MQVTSQDLFEKLMEYGIVGQKGEINFTLKDLSIKITSRDTVGNLIQDWLQQWMMQQKIEFEVNDNSQVFPDIYLDKHNKKQGLLEVKTFDFDRGPGFDIANFDSYCNSLLTSAYRLDSDYLIVGYKMIGHEITIAGVWLKKIWEMAAPSSTYPLKVQEKKKIIYNIRPIKWYSVKTKFKPFAVKEDFLRALNETRYQYPQTRFANGHWLKEVKTNYAEHTGMELIID
ncbi:NgoBV family restriction endonuclease [Mucilaginibacter rubeus]|uniref:NgoBV family restriction endonuclease n=1 Tax=Mucilaginibacter rubeus TaxID=2027860 RepID=A0AAE6JJ49_9SPHI|nr:MULTISPECIES: NgoBV family restriction endonuclease [Mucilaginibacter]QEM06762.1 NgoBV family restriction endonuclease [Mucilaginibacter rubeus]QEM19350.1 NgoBV family restriction endonuclease [Mucilaginibacter gossypii]QTE44101.1 NgoBV family restriction endonuclease [Mucilaginibacter rubeus]QTE50702.1 NgoBV family restriction endonuclease [Mucilaginibacter rubeus]QTE55784.1 NgoBV family restriction endonuclease [Mucilaginibacter rubeus]